MTDIIHHRFSPSALQQYSICPASWAMQLGLPDVPSPEAIEGTRLHAAVASGDVSSLAYGQPELIEACQQFIREKAAEIIGHEVKLTISDEDGNELCYGFADLVFRDADGTLCGVDWKFGFRRVPEVKRNFQCAPYALGLMQKFNEPRCKFYIFQPRLRWEDSYLFEKGGAIIRNIKTIIERCKNTSKMEFNPGEVCNYCKAKSTCPAFQRCFRQLINTALTDATDTQIAELFEQCKMAESFAREVKSALEKRIAQNGSCGEWYFTEKPGNREIQDIAGVYSVCKSVVTPEELFAQCKVSVPGVIDLLAGKAIAAAAAAGEKKTQKAAKSEAEEALAEFISRGKTTKVLTKGA